MGMTSSGGDAGKEWLLCERKTIMTFSKRYAYGGCDSLLFNVRVQSRNNGQPPVKRWSPHKWHAKLNGMIYQK